jgi:hypothetical protein
MLVIAESLAAKFGLSIVLDGVRPIFQLGLFNL